MLLFKAAQARNLPVMLEAFANKADPNWISTENEDKTPIMKAIETVSIQVYKFSKVKVTLTDLEWPAQLTMVWYFLHECEVTL